MKKYFIFMLFLCWAIPLSANAEFLEENSSFQIAKVNKIGRGEVFFNGMSAKIAGQSRYEEGSQEHSQIAHMCNSLCDDCVYTSGTCLKCSDPDNYYLSDNGSDNQCNSCPANATCNGVSFTCNTGYYLYSRRGFKRLPNGKEIQTVTKSCASCENVSISNGTCTECSDANTCTAATCDEGYVANGGTCVPCGSIVNGTCTACTYSNGATTCTAANCNSGYGFIRKRSDNGVAVQWEAGCYPKGTCASYNEYPLCMFVSEATGKGQCKGDYGNGHFANTGIECTACGDGTMWVQDQKTCVNCSTISVAHGSCTSCLNGACTAVTCETNYHPNDEGTACVRDQCVTSSNCSFPNGTCTSCSGGVCTAGTCNNGYAFRKRRAESGSVQWEAGCYPTNGCASYGSGASCMFVSESNSQGQCKTDSTWGSQTCTACPAGSHWSYAASNVCGHGTCVEDGCENISVTNGTCTACSSGSCTAVSCYNGYYKSGTSCAACSSISVTGGSCTACNSITGACTDVSCKSGYYKSGASCAACPSVSNGTCSACSNGSSCTTFSCNCGYKKSGNSCVACTALEISRGTCAMCIGSNNNNYQLANPYAP